MPRKPRTFFAGAVHHVYFRGNQKKTIFNNNSDYEKYIDRLENLSYEEKSYVHAYSIMPNHGHIILQQVTENPIANLMHRLQGGFAQYWNTKYQKVGHIFQGRYKCLLCQDERYLLELVRYVHLNAPRAGLVELPENYPWCSHRDYLSSSQKSFVFTGLIKSYFTDSRAFDIFVKLGLSGDMQFNNTNLSIETAIRKGLPHPLPTLEDLNSQIQDQNRNKFCYKTKVAFIKLAQEYGYTIKDISTYLNLSRVSVYRILNKNVTLCA